MAVMQTTSLPNIFARVVKSDNNYCSDKFESKYEAKYWSSKPGISFVEECGVDDGFGMPYIPFSAYDFIGTFMSDCLTFFTTFITVFFIFFTFKSCQYVGCESYNHNVIIDIPTMIRGIEVYRILYKWNDEAFILPVEDTNIVQGGISYCEETVKCDIDISSNNFVVDIEAFRLSVIECDIHYVPEYFDIF